MLLGFSVENVLSLRDEQTFSMVSGGLDNGPVQATGLISGGKPVQTLPAVGIYGANASGKTNVLNALRWMRAAVVGSYARWAEAGRVPRTPFALDSEAVGKPSSFEIDLAIDEDRWVYGFEVSNTRVEAEWLHRYPGRRRLVRRQVWFDRDATADEEFRFPGDHFRGERSTLVRLTRPDALFLSTAATGNHAQLMVLYRWFRDNLRLVDAGSDRVEWEWFTAERVLAGDRERIVELLRVADLGVDDVEIARQKSGPPKIYLIRMVAGERVTFDFEQESHGTRHWFALLGPLLAALDNGMVLLVDEMDESLHPSLVAEFIRIFQDSDANPNNAQLIFAAHDTAPLGTTAGDPPLSREGVWLTEKHADGATELYPLTDARPRKDENLERSYRAGRYGGIPRIVSGQAARKLGYLRVAGAHAGVGG